MPDARRRADLMQSAFLPVYTQYTATGIYCSAEAGTCLLMGLHTLVT